MLMLTLMLIQCLILYDSAAGAGSLPSAVSSLGKNFLFSSCADSNASLNNLASVNGELGWPTHEI